MTYRLHWLYWRHGLQCSHWLHWRHGHHRLIRCRRPHRPYWRHWLHWGKRSDRQHGPHRSERGTLEMSLQMFPLLHVWSNCKQLPQMWKPCDCHVAAHADLWCQHHAAMCTQVPRARRARRLETAWGRPIMPRPARTLPSPSPVPQNTPSTCAPPITMDARTPAFVPAASRPSIPLVVQHLQPSYSCRNSSSLGFIDAC